MYPMARHAASIAASEFGDFVRSKTRLADLILAAMTVPLHTAVNKACFALPLCVSSCEQNPTI